MYSDKKASHFYAEKEDEIETLILYLRNQLPSVFGRSKIDLFFPGVMSSKTQANLDSSGKGPPSFRHGRLIFYNRDLYLDWLKNRIKSI